MQEIKQLRKALGLSQMELAELLQVSKGLLAMAEIGKRALSYEANASLATLQLAVESTPKELESEQTIFKSEKSTQIFNKLIRTNTHLLKGHLDRQEKQLEQIKQKERLIAIAEQNEAEAIWPKGTEASDLYKLLKRKAEQELAALNSDYIKLKIKIYGLQNEIELANVLKIS